MKFQDKFKPGDIICSDHFHNGLCMVVEYGRNSSIRGEFNYRCDDLVREKQRMDVIWEDGAEETIDYTRTQALLINMIFDFEFIGEL